MYNIERNYLLATVGTILCGIANIILALVAHGKVYMWYHIFMAVFCILIYKFLFSITDIMVADEYKKDADNFENKGAFWESTEDFDHHIYAPENNNND